MNLIAASGVATEDASHALGNVMESLIVQRWKMKIMMTAREHTPVATLNSGVTITGKSVEKHKSVLYSKYAIVSDHTVLSQLMHIS